jgi:threonine dehydrogenase-like Zn-dependent dehydrogenase
MDNGFFPQPKPLIMGHEFLGIVEEVGPEITTLRRGDRVVVPFPIRLDDIITHRLPLSEAPHGYEIFNEKKEDCVKVVLSP